MKSTATLFTKNHLVLELFNKALSVYVPNIPFKEMNEFSMSVGYVVHPSLCAKDIYQWIASKKLDTNKTFYKTWSDITSKDRFELFIDQILHYASTYGTNFEGKVYLPEGITEAPELTSFKKIQPITEAELITRCENMLFSGIALQQQTIENILAILTELDYKIDIDMVRNKEAKMFLYKQTGALPTDPTEMVRYLVYLSTEKTLLIKDEATILTIKAKMLDINGIVKEFGIEKLASVFFRFKRLFLAFKSNPKNSKLINKLRKLANEYHKPMISGYFETLLSSDVDVTELRRKLKSLTNFKKVTLLQTINVRKKNLSNRAFVIRNQKLFIKTGDSVKTMGNLDKIYNEIYSNLVETMSKKATTITLPSGMTLKIPTSEKSFIGNYPLGTAFDFSDANNIVGINWKSSDGAHDLDLSLMSVDGNKYGWNANYYNGSNSIVYSGDMTSANPEATELFFASKGFSPSIVKVNLYSGEMNSKFKFFIAREKITDMNRNYMVDPNNVLFTIDNEMDSKEKSLGVIADDKFILTNFRTGRGAVSHLGSVTDLYTDYALETIDCYLDLKQLLIDAGFDIVENEPAIDLRELSKDSLIQLFS